MEKVLRLYPFVTESLPVSFALLHNLPVSDAFSNTRAPTQASNSCSTESHRQSMPELNMNPNVMPSVTSDVLTAQIGAARMALNSHSLLINAISLNFTFETTQNSTITSYYYYKCAYWNFSDP